MSAETQTQPAFSWHRNDVDRSIGLVSLWDILNTIPQASASRVAELLAGLSRWETRFEWQRFAHGKATEYGVDERQNAEIKSLAETAVKVAEDFDLPMSSSKVSALLAVLAAKHPLLTHTDATHRIREVRETMVQELFSIQFLPIPPSRAKYVTPYPFGPRVAERFKSARYDISEAGMCFAFGRWTATVMHCMRVLEFGLDALGKCLGARRGFKGWGRDLENFSAKWEKTLKSWKTGMPALGWKRQLIPKLISQFTYFELAWRNHAMHAREKYGEVEAGQVFEHVMAFMQLISERLREPKKTRLRSTPST